MNDDIKYIPTDIARRIKDDANILDVVTDLTGMTPRKEGVNYMMLCPFHDDHNATNFSISVAKNRCKCFVCDKGGKPIDFVMQYNGWSYTRALLYLADMEGIIIPNDTERVQREKAYKSIRKMPKPVTPPTPQHYEYIPTEKMKETEGRPSALLDFLLGVFPDEALVHDAFNKYHIGASADGRTIFWYINTDGKVCEGKVIKYNQDGHRNKEKDAKGRPIYSPYTLASKMGVNNAERCLFGENLIKGCNSTLALVEAEKTALIMSMCLPQLCWLSCGGASHLNASIAECMKGHKILVFPDADQVDTWKDKVKELKGVGLDAHIKTDWMRYATSEDGEKFDIADLEIRLRIAERAKAVARSSEPTPQEQVQNPKPLPVMTKRADTATMRASAVTSNDILLGIGNSYVYELAMSDHMEGGMPF